FRGSVVEGVETYFLGSDVFVLPGLGGLAISEAMVYGLPVIASIGDGCEVDLVDEKNGFLDPELDEDRLLNYLDELYNNRDLLESFKKGSREKIINNYNVENYVSKILNSIEGK